MNGRHRRAVPLSIVDGAVPESRPLTAGRSRLFASWALALTLTAIVAKPAAAQLVASPNVNVAGGPACLRSDEDPSCRAQVFGDVSMQRQNELSMACSSRNPQTCLAAGNDYRLIGVSGENDGKVTADAWMGIFWSRNAGQSWRSSLLPGWKTSDPRIGNDSTPEGAPAQNPIAGFEAAADATVRAGTHGLFYVSGIAFNRADEANGTSSGLSSGGEGKSGVQFVATFIDDNNTSDPNVPPRFLRISIVDSGTSGRFLDKPWTIADVPRGNATCTIPAGPGGNPAAQNISAGVVYVAWATFLGSGNNPHSDIWVKNSRDCGETWSNATKLTSSIPLSQSPIIVLNPTNGNVHVVWREFGQGGSPDRILTASSTNEAKTFGKPVEVANLGVPGAVISSAFDQTTVPESRPLTAGRSRLFASWALALTLTAIVAKPAAARLVASPNVNVAGGPACLRSAAGCRVAGRRCSAMCRCSGRTSCRWRAAPAIRRRVWPRAMTTV